MGYKFGSNQKAVCTVHARMEHKRIQLYGRVLKAYFLAALAPSTIFSTTVGSCDVVISPNASHSPSAIFRNILRMIFPERVFGKSETNCIISGLAIAPIKRVTVNKTSCLVFSASIWWLAIMYA